MKKILVSILAVAALLCSCSKFDDSAIRDRIKALDARCEALSSKLNDNAKAISALVKLEGKTISGVYRTKDNDGWYILFSDGSNICIYNGEDGSVGQPGQPGQPGTPGDPGEPGGKGDDGVQPVLGVKEVNGIVYWTVNGELVLYNGAPVPVSGTGSVTPQFKIEGGKWLVSYNGGTSWEEIGPATVSGTASGITLEEQEDAFVFTLADGTKISVPKTAVFKLVVSEQEVEFAASSSVNVSYTLTGADETTKVVVSAQGVSAVLDAENAKVAITFPAEAVQGSYVLLRAIRNSDSAVVSQYITVKTPQAPAPDPSPIDGTYKVKNLMVLGCWGTGAFVEVKDKSWMWNSNVNNEYDNILEIAATMSGTNAVGKAKYSAGADGKFWDYVLVAGQNKLETGAVDLSNNYGQLPHGESDITVNLADGTAKVGSLNAKAMVAGSYPYTIAEAYVNNAVLTVPEGCIAIAFQCSLYPQDKYTWDASWANSDFERFMLHPFVYVMIFQKQ